MLNAILSDLMSRIWMTYRRGFPGIGENHYDRTKMSSVEKNKWTAQVEPALSRCLNSLLSAQGLLASPVMWVGAARSGADKCYWLR